jgi:hypothetical protein
MKRVTPQRVPIIRDAASGDAFEHSMAPAYFTAELLGLFG